MIVAGSTSTDPKPLTVQPGLSTEMVMDPSAPKPASKQECLKQKKSPLRLRGGGAAKDCFLGLIACFLCLECCEGCCDCIGDIICCPCEMCCED